ncbi:MAG: ribosome-binding factor A [Saprospiraceae bacterium]|nr:ribosome-binding factor A [Saprospiraceae bacterium]
MESIRQKQVGELIRRQFSMVLIAEGQYVYGTKALVTVTQVMMSPDLALAKIYLSIFNIDNKQEVLHLLEEHYARLKQALHSRLKKQIRAMPEMKSYIDDTMDEVYKVEALFKKFDTNTPNS